jgi:hypothetical protein
MISVDRCIREIRPTGTNLDEISVEQIKIMLYGIFGREHTFISGETYTASMIKLWRSEGTRRPELKRDFGVCEQ